MFLLNSEKVDVSHWQVLERCTDCQHDGRVRRNANRRFCLLLRFLDVVQRGRAINQRDWHRHGPLNTTKLLGPTVLQLRATAICSDVRSSCTSPETCPARIHRITGGRPAAPNSGRRNQIVQYPTWTRRNQGRESKTAQPLGATQHRRVRIGNVESPAVFLSPSLKGPREPEFPVTAERPRGVCCRCQFRSSALPLP